MDAIKGFFSKYHAVPGDDSGPNWKAAGHDALIAWINGECALLRRGTCDPKRVLLTGAITEAWARIGRLFEECASRPADWPGRKNIATLLATFAANTDVLEVVPKSR